MCLLSSVVVQQGAGAGGGDACSFHMIHHLPSMHGDFMSYDTSPTIDAWSCHMIHHRWQVMYHMT